MLKNNRKLLLAAVREGDYAHAGEAEAIEIAMNSISKNPQQLLLDVGCGLGGTAHYLEKKGWGKVIGIDRDQSVLDHAQKNYPDIQFLNCDVENLDSLFPKRMFDAIYSFNAFFCFRDQKLSLQLMEKVSKKTAELIIFDYSTPDSFDQGNPFYDHLESASSQIFSPLSINTLETFLKAGGWRLKNKIDLSKKYSDWYETLIKKMDDKKTDLVRDFGQATFDDLYMGYTRLLELLSRKIVGGLVLYATPF